MTKSIEGKLPETLKKDWLTYAADVGSTVNSQNRFDKLIAFLKSQESIYEQLDQLSNIVEPAKEKTMFVKYSRTKTAKSSSEPIGCIICGDPKHRKKLFFCRRFRTNLKPQEKRDAAQRLGACKRCLEVHNGDFCSKTTYLCGNPECKDQQHYLLCPVARSQSQRTLKPGPVRAERKRYTEAQEEFLSKLSPELVQQCRNAFCNVTSMAYNSTAAERGLLEENGLKEYPVMLMLLDVAANDGQRIGTLIDLASDTNYITHRAASKLNLRGEDVTLVVYGVGGMKVSVTTKRYLLKIRINTPRGTLKSHQLICYGLDKIAEVHRHVPATKLQKIFPDVPLKDLARPKDIQLLISHKEGQLVPQKIRSVGDLVLWDGPLGKTVGGTHPSLFDEVTLMAHASKTHFARSMRTATIKYSDLICKDPISRRSPDHLNTQSNTATSSRDSLKWWKGESIGAACEPRCQSGRKGPRGEKMGSKTTILPNQLTRRELLSQVSGLYDPKGLVAPANQKGEPVKAEMCGAVFAAQPENIADILTNGASPDALTEESEWRSGPSFHQLPECEWPKKSAKEVLTQSRQKAQDPIRVQKTESKFKGPPAVAAVQKLLDERRFSNRRRLVGTIAWTWRAKQFLRAKTGEKEKWEAVPSSGVSTVNEREGYHTTLRCPAPCRSRPSRGSSRGRPARLRGAIFLGHTMQRSSGRCCGDLPRGAAACAGR